jgi:hypothetical protein
LFANGEAPACVAALLIQARDVGEALINFANSIPSPSGDKE